MDVIMIEKSDFDNLFGRIEEIAEHIRKSEKMKCSDRTERWISGAEAMEMLGVSTRTLQRYRDNGLLQFSKIGKKCRYRLLDVKRILEKCMVCGTEEKPDALHRQYLVRTGKISGLSRKT